MLSLKAEILRKQDELSKVKVQNNINIAQHVKKNTPLDIKNKGIEKRMVNEIVEDEDLLRKSRLVLNLFIVHIFYNVVLGMPLKLNQGFMINCLKVKS